MEKILIVEDDQEVRSSLSEILATSGFEVVEAEDGKAGLEKVFEVIPDLIISDIMMPKMDGYELLNALQNDEKTGAIPFILLSAKSDHSDIRKGMNIGADDYLTKPFRAKELLEAVQTRINKKRMHDKKWEELANNLSQYIPHELRTPLVSVLGFSQIILEEFDTLSEDMMRDLAYKVNKAGKRLYDRIEKFIIYSDVELLSKDDIMQKELKSESIEISDLLFKEMLLESFSLEERIKEIEYYIDTAEIKITRVYVQVLLKELLENAIKFSTKGDKIKITGKMLIDVYELVFHDTGIGIAQNDLNGLFLANRFQKNESGNIGNGFGLIIVRKICDIFKCKIRIESELNVFTKVTITIPLMK
ncbi:MAG: response regulator [Melioribacteraceae bacterium]|nr:response regulator [Melioribacteraceae bacterium]MCF8355172.1 response regulator [Melioribacteraceae bacterium]MCF8392501.1 response regulator [Melioribacteraceae bacterium]MCF8418412.1 response regulator [Melioribacteraceae bacterium]